MSEATRLTLAVDHDPGPVMGFVRTLQEGIDDRDADRFTGRSPTTSCGPAPFGALVNGYDALHSMHTRMFESMPQGVRSRYDVEQLRFWRFPTDDVAITYVRRTSDCSRMCVATDSDS